MKKYLTPKFIIPSLAVFLMGAYALQTAVWVEDCYGSLTTQAMVDALGNPFSRVTCTELAQVTPTPAGATATPPRGTVTPPIGATATNPNTPPVGATSTPRGTPASTQIATPSPVVTQTPLPTQSGTQTALCPQHANAWHPPLNLPCFHHVHGADPYSEEIRQFYAQYGFDTHAWLNEHGALFQEAWVSSPKEVADFAAGFVWIDDDNPNCDQLTAEDGTGGGDVSKQGCIRRSTCRLHMDGMLDHAVLTRHSAACWLVLSLKDGNGEMNDSPQTSIVVTMGWLPDSGEKHRPYKVEYCPMPGDDPYYALTGTSPDLKNGSLYTALPIRSGQDGVSIGWWLQPRTLQEMVKGIYEHDPNSMVGYTIIEEGWQIIPTDEVCGMTDIAEIQRILGEYPIDPAGGHNRFQVFNIKVKAQLQIPYHGYVDPNAHVLPPGDEICPEPSAGCIPYDVWTAVTGEAALDQLQQAFAGVSFLLQRRVGAGDCTKAPCHVYPTNGVELLPPSLDVP